MKAACSTGIPLQRALGLLWILLHALAAATAGCGESYLTRRSDDAPSPFGFGVTCSPEAFPEDSCINPAAANTEPLAEESSTEQSLDDEDCETHLDCAVGEICSASGCVDAGGGAPHGARCDDASDCAGGQCLDVDGKTCDADGGVQCSCVATNVPSPTPSPEPSPTPSPEPSPTPSPEPPPSPEPGAQDAPPPAATPPPPDPCVNNPPSFKVDPIRRNGGGPGVTVWYGLYMTSHDTGGCGGRLLNIQLDLPGPKWSSTPGQATLAVGDTNKKVGIQVTASPDATPGVKTLTLRVVGAYNGHTLFTRKLEYVVN